MSFCMHSRELTSLPSFLSFSFRAYCGCSRYPELAPLGLLRFGPVELSIDVSWEAPYCCKSRSGVQCVPHPNATPARHDKTYLEVHFRDIVESFVRSGLAISGGEACERHFGQHGSGLGIHLPLQVSYGVLLYAGQVDGFF